MREEELSGVRDPRSYGDGVIRTHAGIYVDLLNPTVDMIILADISHALSHLCRFGGHTNCMMPVSLHSMFVASVVPDEHKIAALLHDASEAYLIDLPSPIKALLPEYKVIEDRLMRVIAERFDFQYPFVKEIHEADKKALNHEWDLMMVGSMYISYNHKYIMSQFELDYRKYKDFPRNKFKK